MTLPIYLLAAFSILFFILALRRLDLALAITIAALPSYLLRFQLGPLPLTLLEAMILISALAWAIAWLWPRLRQGGLADIKPAKTWVIEAGLVILISLAAVFVAGGDLGAWGIWNAYFLEPILLLIMAVTVFKGAAGREKVLWAIVISVSAVSLLAIFQKATGLFIANPFWQAAETRRSVSFFGYPNAVGLYLAPLSVLLLGWLAGQDWKTASKDALKKSLIALAIAISWLAILFARSEGAIIGLGAGIFLAMVLAGRRMRLAGISLAVISVALILSVPSLRQEAGDKLTLSDLSGSIRQQQWKETFMMLSQDRFFLGAGLDKYQAAVAPYHQAGLFFNADRIDNFDEKLRQDEDLRNRYWQPVEIYLYPHNIFLNFWSELGLLGALAFSWIIIKFLFLALLISFSLKRVEQRQRFLALGLLAAMVAIVVHGLVDVPYFKNDLSAMFWLILALLAGFKAEWQSKLAKGQTN